MTTTTTMTTIPVTQDHTVTTTKRTPKPSGIEPRGGKYHHNNNTSKQECDPEKCAPAHLRLWYLAAATLIRNTAPKRSSIRHERPTCTYVTTL